MRRLPVFFPILALFAFFFSCTSTSEPQLTGKTTDQFKDHEIWSPEIIITQGEHMTIRSQAEKLVKNNNENALLTGSVVTDFFNENGEHSSILYSDSARIRENTNSFEAIGHVKVISDSGLTLQTRKLIWDNRYKLVISKDSVMFTTESEDTLYGVGFESDMDLSHWRIEKPTGVTSREFK